MLEMPSPAVRRFQTQRTALRASMLECLQVLSRDLRRSALPSAVSCALMFGMSSVLF